MSDRNKPVEYLKKYLGIKERSKQHKEIIKVFNDSKLCKRYVMTDKDSWCATAVSAAFIATNLNDIFNCVECSCKEMIDKAKENKIWVEDDKFVPQTGDVIMYDWNDDGKGDNTGWPDHTGIVVSVNNGTIKVIEGNKEDTVAYRDIPVNGKYIRGYITPKYKVEEKKVEEDKPKLNKTTKYFGVVTANLLNVRTWAGTENSLCSFSPIKKNTRIEVCDTIKAKDKSDWLYIKVSGKHGFVSSKYIKRI